MTLADVDKVLSIELAVQIYPWTRGNFTDALTHGYIGCVEEADNEIRGYAVWMPVVDEAELLSIGVASVWQRKGIGRAILNEILEIAHQKNMRRVFLEVRASNVAAITLYRSIGFAEIGLRRNYYQGVNGSEDAIVMACDLPVFISES